MKQLLHTKYPRMFRSFASVESTHDEKLTDVRRARSNKGGFAFEYWCRGGDIDDVQGFLDYRDSVLEKMNPAQESRSSDGSSNHRVTLSRKSSFGSSDKTHDAWSLPLAERTKLIAQWKKEIGRYTSVDALIEIHRRFWVAKNDRKKIQNKFDARCIGTKRVVAMTTTACAQEWSMLNTLGLETLVCEEAGEIPEAHTLSMLFPSIKHAIFIGDPLQLRPRVNQPGLSMTTQTGRKYRLDESLFERMVSPSTPNVKPLPFSKLTVQRRMHPDVADIMRATLYPFLEDHVSTARPPIAGMVHRTFWLDHQQPEDRRDPLTMDGNSYSNAFECAMICGLTRYLLNT